jgi:hypothetical protein
MKYILRKHKYKIIIFSILKKLFLIYVLSSSLLRAEGTYSGVYFTDYEENATIYLCNYYPYQHFKNLYISSSTSKNIINNRFYTSISDIDDVSGVAKKQLRYLREDSHLIDWNKYTDDFGMTLHQTNFIYALSGVLIGFSFLFVFISIVKG